MPFYEYRCRTCDTTFERQRTMADADATMSCPDGHADTVRILTVFSTGRTGSAADRSFTPAATRSGGCGGACTCH